MAVMESPTRETENETSPLLERTPTFPLEDHPRPSIRNSWIFLVVSICIIVVTLDLGAYLTRAPLTRLYEAQICLRYYERHDPSKIHNGNVDEELCKIDWVQDKLAVIFGWQDLWDSIPGILLAVPYGALADKYGRKWIFVVALIGLTLQFLWQMFICYFQFPLRLVWLSSGFLLLGGGSVVASAVGLTMISDVVPPEKRMTVYLYLQASNLVAELVAPALSSALMIYGNWPPMEIAVFIVVLATAFTALIPETLHLKDTPEPCPLDTTSDDHDSSSKDSKHGLKAQMKHMKDALAFVKRDFSLALVVFCFLVNRIGRQSLDLLIRYVSKRYDWTIRKAALLLSLRAATNLAAVLILIPVISMLLLKKLKFSPQKSDLWIARGCIIVTATAFIIMGLAPTPPVLMLGLVLYNLGTGFAAAMRSVAIFIIGGQASPDIGRLFAVIAIMEGVGVFISGPALAQFFRWGIQLGSAFLGMPYIISGILFAFIACITFWIKVQDLAILTTDEETLILESDTLDYERTRETDECTRTQ